LFGELDAQLDDRVEEIEKSNNLKSAVGDISVSDTVDKVDQQDKQDKQGIKQKDKVKVDSKESVLISNKHNNANEHDGDNVDASASWDFSVLAAWSAFILVVVCVNYEYGKESKPVTAICAVILLATFCNFALDMLTGDTGVDTDGVAALPTLPNNTTFLCLEKQATCTIVNKLGEGSFGKVYLTDVQFLPSTSSDYSVSERRVLSSEEILKSRMSDSTKFQVALKQVLSTKSDTLKTLTEAFSWMSLPPHPSITDLYHVEIQEEGGGDSNAIINIYQEYINGNDMSQIIIDPFSMITGEETLDVPHPIDTKTLLQLSSELAVGTSYVHDYGIHHFDIKPANMMTDADDDDKVRHIKIIDFGIAKEENDDENDDFMKYFKSVTGGTNLYMSPEVRDNGICTTDSYVSMSTLEKTLFETEMMIDFPKIYIMLSDIASCNSHDQWALALSLIELWLGDGTGVLLHSLSLMGVDISKLDFGVDPGTWEKVMTMSKRDGVEIPKNTRREFLRMLSPDPKDRPHNVDDFLEAVKADAADLKHDLTLIEPPSTLESAKHFLLQGHTLYNVARKSLTESEQTKACRETYSKALENFSKAIALAARDEADVVRNKSNRVCPLFKGVCQVDAADEKAIVEILTVARLGAAKSGMKLALEQIKFLSVTGEIADALGRERDYGEEVLTIAFIYVQRFTAAADHFALVVEQTTEADPVHRKAVEGLFVALETLESHLDLYSSLDFDLPTSFFESAENGARSELVKNVNVEKNLGTRHGANLMAAKALLSAVGSSEDEAYAAVFD
jgi:serine/threonine protein kinase